MFALPFSLLSHIVLLCLFKHIISFSYFPPSPSLVEASNAETLEAPLHEAAKRGNLPFLQECLKNNVSVNGLDKVSVSFYE